MNSILPLGDYRVGSTVRVWVNTLDTLGQSADPTGVELRIFKNSDPNQRYSGSGITLVDTFDSMAGVALIEIDLSDDTDAGFYAAGNDYAIARAYYEVEVDRIRNTIVAVFSIENRVLDANISQINASAPAAVNLARGATSFVSFTVDSGSFTPTTTQFETDLTEATADHYKDMRVIWLTGALAKGNPRNVDAYTLAAGKGHFTVAAMTEAPANGDTGILVP